MSATIVRKKNETTLPADVLAQAGIGVKDQVERIHDLLHAKAAEKATADELWTVDRNDFNGLGLIPVRQL